MSLADYDVTLPPLPVKLKDIIEFKIDDFPAGRASQYGFFISRKISEGSLTENHAPHLRENLTDAIDIYLRMSKFLSTARTDRMVLDNDLYGFNAAAKAAAEKVGVPCVSINLGPSLSNFERSVFLVSDSSTLNLGRVRPPPSHSTSETREDQNHQVRLSHLKSISRDLNKKLYGRHYMNYSRPGPRRPACDGEKRKKYAASLLLSSSDEFNAYNFVRGLSVPSDQTALLRRFFLHAERNQDDLFHVRPHPRFAITHRDAVEAAELVDYLKVCSQAPENVVIDPLSDLRPIVEILRSSDCIVGAWSSTMIDAAILGIPIVFGIPGVPQAYPDDLGVHVEDEEVKTLTAAIAEAKSLDRFEQHAIALNYSCDLLRASRQGKFLPISFSPAFLILAMHQRASIGFPPVIHRLLRRVECSISRGFRSTLNSSDSVLQIEPTLTREGPRSAARANSAEVVVPPEHSFSILQSVLERRSRSRRLVTRLKRSIVSFH